MTTPAPDDYLDIAQIRDRESLVLVSRVLESQRIVLEAQLNQLQQISKAVEERMRGLG
jgi:hypothetical protein